MQTTCYYYSINYPEERSGSVRQLQLLHILTDSSFLFPLIVAIWMGVKQCLIVVFIFIFLVISDIDHCFHLLISYSCIFFGKLSVQVLGPFLTWVFGTIWWNHLPHHTATQLSYIANCRYSPFSKYIHYYAREGKESAQSPCMGTRVFYLQKNPLYQEAFQ